MKFLGASSPPKRKGNTVVGMTTDHDELKPGWTFKPIQIVRRQSVTGREPSIQETCGYTRLNR
jgi:hypothetical protein